MSNTPKLQRLKAFDDLHDLLTKFAQFCIVKSTDVNLTDHEALLVIQEQAEHTIEVADLFRDAYSNALAAAEQYRLSGNIKLTVGENEKH